MIPPVNASVVPPAVRPDGLRGGNGAGAMADAMPMDSTLQLLILRFPAFQELILDQMAGNPRLRALSADYGEALAAHARWERVRWECAGAPQADACARDYRRLVAELERELLRELLDIDAAAGPAGRWPLTSG